ncbi:MULTISPECIES: hypothetical protein [Clostridium]|uniref:Uncharacterized protein n=2 Tax=Clostridium TaxID=1485 RepID=C6PQQ2_9CLOT|nr:MULTISPECIES: hypothetical protein [Clostridium]AKA70109.1 hypothetical protein CSCA_2984 [Clostridium scatologenes]EET88424.1 hypothetical protein CcarbDRAFT_1119 [Clostridium carboxidivorans P7]EFG88086.1 hypothetical protein CLCAR_2074 [Clostridium carboxidivorans P7]WPC40893.1 hypothetical protein Q6H37_23825 [Clostridium sp. JS66]
MKLDLDIEEIKNIKDLLISRINDLRDKLADDQDKEEEVKEIIRNYKRLVKKIESQI